MGVERGEGKRSEIVSQAFFLHVRDAHEISLVSSNSTLDRSSYDRDLRSVRQDSERSLFCYLASGHFLSLPHFSWDPGYPPIGSGTSMGFLTHHEMQAGPPNPHLFITP